MNKFVDRFLKDIESGKRVSPLRAIRARCLDCCGFQEGEVRRCPSKDCPLWKFRFGKNTTGQKKQPAPAHQVSERRVEEANRPRPV